MRSIQRLAIVLTGFLLLAACGSPSTSAPSTTRPSATPTMPITAFALLTPSSHAEWITAGPDGALWFTESQGNKIGRITTSGTIREFSLPTRFSFPFGITAGPDGALWFTDNAENKIGRISATQP